MKLVLGIAVLLGGILILFASSGIPAWGNLLVNLFLFWPVFLVLVGIGILASMKSFRWLRYVNVVLAMCFLLFLFLYPGSKVFETSSGTNAFAFAVENSQKLQVVTSLPVLELVLRDAPCASACTISGFFTGDPDAVKIENRENRLFFSRVEDRFRWVPGVHRLELQIPSGMEVEIISDGLYLEAKLDFHRNPVHTIDVRTGLFGLNGSIVELDKPLHVWVRSVVFQSDLQIPPGSSFLFKESGGAQFLDFAPGLRRFEAPSSMYPPDFLELFVEAVFMKIDLDTL
ncbi:MAG TPA: hypothetical protein P5560_02030 [Thermotogota bacterium]|nr:hypothetical protein [Thermotogota bacterium]HRW91706.1 hypothetical protein [Thermotogota bacterium]